MKEQTRTERKLWIGIDFHKVTWRVHFRSEFSGNPFSMEPDPDGLHKKVSKEFSGYSVEVVYECGCFGYWAHRKFESYGWKSYVVNPSDIPRVSKQKYQKTDTIDARNLSKLLRTIQRFVSKTRSFGKILSLNKSENKESIDLLWEAYTRPFRQCQLDT